MGGAAIPIILVAGMTGIASPSRFERRLRSTHPTFFSCNEQFAHRCLARTARRVTLSHTNNLHRRANQVHISARPASARGAYRDRHDTRGGMRWTRRVAALESADERHGADVKSCGPGIPVLMPSLRCDERVGDGGKKAGPRGDHV